MTRNSVARTKGNFAAIHFTVCNAESSAIVRKNSICGLVSMYCGKVRAIVIDYFSCNPIAKPTFNAIHDIVPSIADSFQKILSGPNCWRIQSRSNVQDGVSLCNVWSDIYIYTHRHIHTYKYSNSRNVPFFQFLFLSSFSFETGEEIIPVLEMARRLDQGTRLGNTEFFQLTYSRFSVKF